MVRTLRLSRAVRGLSLIELMVGIAVGLIGMVAVFRALALWDTQTRSISAGEDAQVTGTLVIPGTGTCDVVADKARYATPAPLLPPLPVLLLTSATTGTYTVSFPHKEQTPPLDVTTYPQGDGYATATLTKTGATRRTEVVAWWLRRDR